MPPFAPLSSPPSSPDNHEQAVLNRMKRRIAELEGQVEQQDKKKTSASQSKSYRNLGRCIRKVVSLYEPLENLVAESDRRADLADASDGSGSEGEDSEESTKEQERTFQSYKELCRFIPSMKKIIADSDPRELAKILSDIRLGADSARADDTKNLKEAVSSWIKNADPPLDPDSRENRGVYHEDTGRLICPIDYDWDDESVRTRIRELDPELELSAHSWPRFLYSRGEFDLDDVEKGLLQGELLIKVYKYIFTSPRSVKDDGENDPSQPSKRKKARPSSKRSVASLIGLKTVTPRSLAYAAVQLRVALSDTDYWQDHDGAFDYILFYNNVIDYLEPTGPEAQADVKKLLSWWTSKVFRTSAASDTVSAPANSSVARMNAKRDERERAGRAERERARRRE